jgi:hypothetical protein
MRPTADFWIGLSKFEWMTVSWRKLVQLGCKSGGTRSASKQRELFYTGASLSTAPLAVHSGAFSASDAHAFNRLLEPLAASFQRVGESGASLYLNRVNFTEVSPFTRDESVRSLGER